MRFGGNWGCKFKYRLLFALFKHQKAACTLQRPSENLISADYSGLNLNQDKATKPQTVQIVRQGKATPYWFKFNPLYQSAVFRCFQKHRRYAVMKCGRIWQDGRDGFADFCLEDGRGRLKVEQAFRRPLFYRLCGTRANSGLRLFQADGEQAAQCVAQADFVSPHEPGAADSAFKNAACTEILLRLPQDLPPHDAVQNVQL